jgi:hypothetical protein
MKKIFIVFGILTSLSFVLFNVSNIQAHGFGERYDLPVPLGFFLIGAGLTIILSFIVIGVFVSYAHKRRTPALLGTEMLQSRSMTHKRHNFVPTHTLLGTEMLQSRPMKIIEVLIKICSISIFALLLTTGLFGSRNPAENFSVIFVWIIWWVGFGLVIPIIGNFWTSINPITIIFDSIYLLLSKNCILKKKCTGFRHKYDCPQYSQFNFAEYPRIFRYWPVVFWFLLFAWIENSGYGADPNDLARCVILYVIVSIIGMLVYGKNIWLSRCEVFNVYYNIMGSFGILEFERNEHGELENINIRPPVVGLLKLETGSISFVAFHIILLATITFDGLSETFIWYEAIDLFVPIFGFTGLEFLGLIFMPICFFLAYYVFSWVIYLVAGEIDFKKVLTVFVFALTPIAIAYHIAHYFSYIVITGQMIIPLLSNPFGFGWDIFGTAEYITDISVINAKMIWYLSVITIVLGHVFSILISHVKSSQFYSNKSAAMKSQYPMMVLMVFYTALSLWIVAQPLVEK